MKRASKCLSISASLALGLVAVAASGGQPAGSQACCGPVTDAVSWLTQPSTYTHETTTGRRVSQYAATPAPTAPQDTSFQVGGYSHYRSTLNYGQSADNYHRVETYGPPVRPYGEWRFPFRPYSTPYPNWGPPFGGLNIQPIYPYGFAPTGYPGRPPVGRGGGTGRRVPGGRTPDANTGAGSAGPATSSGTDGGAGDWPVPPRDRRRVPVIAPDPLIPYPAGGNSPYPVAPYYDGYYPVYRD
ncbi:MAG: hypothetical protein AAGA03_08565 [Planctomycetota bacterium]